MEKNYFSLKEISKILNLPTYTIRYWENKFNLIRPIRLSSGHRRYTKNDIENLNKIKELHYIQGYSLKGLRKNLNSKKKKDSENVNLKKQNLNFLEEINQDLKNLAIELLK